MDYYKLINTGDQQNSIFFTYNSGKYAGFSPFEKERYLAIIDILNDMNFSTDGINHLLDNYNAFMEEAKIPNNLDEFNDNFENEDKEKANNLKKLLIVLTKPTIIGKEDFYDLIRENIIEIKNNKNSSLNVDYVNMPLQVYGKELTRYVYLLQSFFQYYKGKNNSIERLYEDILTPSKKLQDDTLYEPNGDYALLDDGSQEAIMCINGFYTELVAFLTIDLDTTPKECFNNYAKIEVNNLEDVIHNILCFFTNMETYEVNSMLKRFITYKMNKDKYDIILASLTGDPSQRTRENESELLRIFLTYIDPQTQYNIQENDEITPREVLNDLYGVKTDYNELKDDMEKVVEKENIGFFRDIMSSLRGISQSVKNIIVFLYDKITNTVKFIWQTMGVYEKATGIELRQIITGILMLMFPGATNILLRGMMKLLGSTGEKLHISEIPYIGLIYQTIRNLANPFFTETIKSENYQKIQTFFKANIIPILKKSGGYSLIYKGIGFSSSQALLMGGGTALLTEIFDKTSSFLQRQKSKFF